MPKLAITKRNFDAARDFLYRKWVERAAEEVGRPVPRDLTGACKFASLFAQALFGGKLRGNEDHQWVETKEGVIDLTGCAGVKRCVYWHDDEWWMNEDHKDSLESCKPRVARWVKEFLR